MIVDAKVLSRFSERDGETFEVWVRDEKGNAEMLKSFTHRLEAERFIDMVKDAVERKVDEQRIPYRKSKKS